MSSTMCSGPMVPLGGVVVMLDSEDELWVWTRDRCVAGCMLYKLRERPKSFNQRAFVNGEWENTLDNVEKRSPRASG